MIYTYGVLEGLDFAGKTGLASEVAKILKWRLVSEPFTETEQGKEVKRLNNSNSLPKSYEMLMIIASRLECFDMVISKHRQSGVISDRNVLSSMVYQSDERFSPATVLEMNENVLLSGGHSIHPDVLIFIDIDHETFLDRLSKCDRKIDEKDIFLKDPKNWEALRNKYLFSLELIERYTGTKTFIVGPDVTVGDIINILKGKNK